MFLLVPAHLGCTRQNPESHKMVVCVCVCVCVRACVRECVYVCRRACMRACIMFSYHGASGPESRTTLCLEVPQMAIPVGHQTNTVFG